MSISHLRSWAMEVPRKWKDTTVLTGELHRVIGGEGCWTILEIYHHLNDLQSIQLKVVQAATGHQMAVLPPVDRLILSVQ